MLSIKCQQQELWFKLNSPFIHYLRTQTPYEEEKLRTWLVQTAVNLLKQRIRCQQQKFSYKLNSQYMHFLRTHNPLNEEERENIARFIMI